MKIKINLSIGDLQQVEDVIEIEDHKLAELSEDEIESVIEIQVRSWVDRMIRIEWETEE